MLLQNTSKGQATSDLTFDYMRVRQIAKILTRSFMTCGWNVQTQQADDDTNKERDKLEAVELCTISWAGMTRARTRTNHWNNFCTTCRLVQCTPILILLLFVCEKQRNTTKQYQLRNKNNVMWQTAVLFLCGISTVLYRGHWEMNLGWPQICLNYRKLVIIGQRLVLQYFWYYNWYEKMTKSCTTNIYLNTQVKSWKNNLVQFYLHWDNFAPFSNFSKAGSEFKISGTGVGIS